MELWKSRLSSWLVRPPGRTAVWKDSRGFHARLATDKFPQSSTQFPEAQQWKHDYSRAKTGTSRTGRYSACTLARPVGHGLGSVRIPSSSICRSAQVRPSTSIANQHKGPQVERWSAVDPSGFAAGRRHAGGPAGRARAGPRRALPSARDSLSGRAPPAGGGQERPAAPGLRIAARQLLLADGLTASPRQSRSPIS